MSPVTKVVADKPYNVEDWIYTVLPHSNERLRTCGMPGDRSFGAQVDAHHTYGSVHRLWFVCGRLRPQVFSDAGRDCGAYPPGYLRE